MRAGTGPRSVVGLRGELTGSRGRSALPGMRPGFAPGRLSAPNWFPRSARPPETGWADSASSGAAVYARERRTQRAEGALRRRCPMIRRRRAPTRGIFDAVKTYVATPATRERNWLLVDAA